MNTMSLGEQPQTLTCAMKFNIVNKGGFALWPTKVNGSGEWVRCTDGVLPGGRKWTATLHSKATGAPQWADILKKAMISWRLIATGRRSYENMQQNNAIIRQYKLKELHNGSLTRLDMRGHRVQLVILYMFGESMATQCALQNNPVQYWTTPILYKTAFNIHHWTTILYSTAHSSFLIQHQTTFQRVNALNILHSSWCDVRTYVCTVYGTYVLISY